VAGQEFLSKLSEDDVKQAFDIVRLGKKALVEANAGNRREAIKLFESILAKAPFDSISMMSIGVQYAHLGNRKKAVRYLEKALEIDASNERIRANLRAIRADFWLNAGASLED
jgi:Flp pilus assembly protein TadD